MVLSLALVMADISRERHYFSASRQAIISMYEISSTMQQWYELRVVFSRLAFMVASPAAFKHRHAIDDSK
jgi:hypothetical protein